MAEHIEVQCVYAREFWQHCFQRGGIQAAAPAMSDTLEDWWKEQRDKQSDRKKKKLMDTFV